MKDRQAEYRCACLFSLSVQVVHFVFKEHDLWKMQPKITKFIKPVCMYVYVLIDTQHSGLLLVSSKNCIF